MTNNKKITPTDQVEVIEGKAENFTKEIVAQENEPVKEMDIDGFLAKRQEFIEKVNKIMVNGKDYHVIKEKKSLAKGGAEKIASIFGWTAIFERDEAVIQSFGDIKGLISFVCNLQKSETMVGQGRGASSLSKNDNDPNKTIKMAQKSAFIDAVIRASGMSDFFTQDLEDMPREEISQTPKTAQPRKEYTTATPKQKQFIVDLCKAKGITPAQVKDLSITYNTPSKLIDYLKGLPEGEEKYYTQPLPVIEQEQSFREKMYTVDEHLTGEAEQKEKEWQEMSQPLTEAQIDEIPF